MSEAPGGLAAIVIGLTPGFEGTDQVLS
jgi:hypothetical protein